VVVDGEAQQVGFSGAVAEAGEVGFSEAEAEVEDGEVLQGEEREEDLEVTEEVEVDSVVVGIVVVVALEVHDIPCSTVQVLLCTYLILSKPHSTCITHIVMS